MFNINLLKTAWYSFIDINLNRICDTKILAREHFISWDRNWNWSQLDARGSILRILSQRLKCVYDARVKLRGWIYQKDYRSLKQELLSVNITNMDAEDTTNSLAMSSPKAALSQVSHLVRTYVRRWKSKYFIRDVEQ